MHIAHNVFYVTGGASGLGLATVHEIVRLGGYVAVLDMNIEAGERIAMELPELVLFSQSDITSEEDVLKAIARTDHKWPTRTVGGLVHCGGIGMAGKTLSTEGEPFSLEAFRHTVEVNLVGSFNVARLVAARIARSHPPPRSHRHPDSPYIEDDRGVIILTSSVSYQEGQMGQAAYGSSKAGVAGLVLPMARDLARYGIRVLAIAPAIFETPMGASAPVQVLDSLRNTHLFPTRFGRPLEFAHLVVACLENQMLNGTVIRLDGGSRMSKM